jgi:hypothetical protein
MSTKTFHSLSDAMAAIAKDMKAREVRIGNAVLETTKDGVPIVQDKVPVAFGEIRDSVHREGTQVVIDAPHAAANNNGSRPHTPPLAPLVAYMRLRGAQDPDAAGRALQQKIAAQGTPPSHFADRSVPPIVQVLDVRVRRALPDP